MCDEGENKIDYVFDVLYGIKQTTMAQEQGQDTTVYNIHAEEIDCVTQEYTVKRSVGDDVYVITAYYSWKSVGLPYVELTKSEYKLYMNEMLLSIIKLSILQEFLCLQGSI